MPACAFGFAVPLASRTAVSAVLLIGAFALLLVGAEVFTNGVEWLGQSLGLGDSATGSILAAVGTALPETMIPVLAILPALLSGTGETDAHGIGVGAILGAPFLLATIAMFLVGASTLYFQDRREHGKKFFVNVSSTKRDLSFFFVGYVLAFVAAFVPSERVTIAIGVFLVAWYVLYVYRTLRTDDFVEGGELDDLHLGRLADGGVGPIPGIEGNPHGQAQNPARWLIVLQTLIALACIVGGAQLFVSEVEFFSSEVVHVPGALISLLLAPFATELPEKFNSILWISRDNDTLALGNITGAMAFQGTLPVTLGIVFTPWNLTVEWGTTGFLNSLAAVLALVGGGIVYLRVRSTDGDTMHPAPFLIGGVLYMIFLAVLLWHVFVVGLTS